MKIFSQYLKIFQNKVEFPRPQDRETLVEEFISLVEKQSNASKKSINKQSKLFKRGLKSGTICFREKNFPEISLPDWFMDLTLKKEKTSEEQEKLIKAIQERQACIFMLSEVYGYFLDTKNQ